MLEVTEQGKAAMAGITKAQHEPPRLAETGTEAGPGSGMHPGEQSAGRYQRGRLTDGRASYGAHYGEPRSAPIAPAQTSASLAETVHKHMGEAGIRSGSGPLADRLAERGMARRGA